MIRTVQQLDVPKGAGAMQATRREIVDVLKKRAGATVDELAKSLGLSPMCIRQHLALLERDGLVSPREVRRRTGRPHYFYTLTERADGLFPKSYDRLATALLDEVKAEGGSERVRGLMRSLGDRMGNRYAESLRDKSIDERLDAVVNILGDGSPLGDWEKTGDGYVLREYDCPYYRVAASHPDVCSFH
jgi:predicted ArsR family transcriptional regulator